MTYFKLRAVRVALLAIGGLSACAQQPHNQRISGPPLGESTAPGPSDPLAPPPVAPGPTEVSARISAPRAGGTSAQPGAPVTTGGGAPAADQTTPGTVVFPGAVTGPAPVGAGAATDAGTAGPNGPGTGNGPATPTGPATGTVTPVAPAPVTPATPPSNGPGTGNQVNPTPAPAPSAPAAPATPPSNGPGTGNQVNPPTTTPPPAAPSSVSPGISTTSPTRANGTIPSTSGTRQR